MADYTTIDDPSAHFQVLTYRGDSSSTTTADRSLTNTGNSDLQPDVVWLYNRDTAVNSGARWWDSSRGVGQNKGISSASNATEGSTNDPEYGYVNTLSSNGFGVRAGQDNNDGRWTTDRGEGGGDKYVAFQWKANGGTTSTNSDGDINTTVQTNSTAGFSIITDSPGNNTARTIGHGLGGKPGFIIRRARNRSENWAVFHRAFESTLPGGWQGLDTTAAYNDSATTLFTSVSNSTFGVGTDYSVNGNYNYITYAWKEVQGYSRFSDFYGNGQADGTFVYCGFKPRWIMITRSDTAGYHWRIYDTARSAASGGNPLDKRVNANLTEAEGTHASDFDVDSLSNGFKLRTSSQINVNAGRYVFVAFAESPFVSSEGTPTTAR